MIRLLSTLVSIEDLGSNYLILPIILTGPNASVHTFALTNSGGSVIGFIDARFTAAHRFSLSKLEKPLVLNIIDGRVISLGHITHYTKILMRISRHTKQIIFLIIKLGHYLVVLGIKWL